MQRPHRSIGIRIQRRVNLLGARLPPRTRRLLRGLADRWAPVIGTTGRRVSIPWSRAECVSTFDAWQVVTDLAAALRTALVDSGVEVVQLERSMQIVLAVPREQRASALQALRAVPAAANWWASESPGKTVALGSARGALLTGEDLSVFRVLSAPNCGRLAGPELAVQLQFWKTVTKATVPRPDGGFFPRDTRVAPTRNGRAPYLLPGQWKEAVAHPEHRVLADAPPHLLELAEPVDVVYTWVDGSDPAWKLRRAGFDPTGARLATDALDPARTTNRDELRYSLRSIAMYANWVRHIWLVTDGQVPSWLAEHPRLTVVHHEDVFKDPEALPTFNSHAIESQLHHITGLAEHFLYLNDDVFFGRPVRPELFFHGNGVAKFALSTMAIDREPEPHPMNGAMLAARRGRDFMEHTVGRTVSHRMQHTPHAHQRSTLAEFESRHPDLFAQVARSRFRDGADLSIASDLGHYYGYAHGKAVEAKLAFRYIDIGSPFASEYFDSLLARRDQDCFCINDVGGYDGPINDARMTEFLRRYFPLPSPFERSEPTD